MTQSRRNFFMDRFRPLLLSFGCGFSVMVLELAGVRLLEPYLGSTIYVWGALIGIFMAALAIGYYTGGALADRRQSFPLLGGMILASALWIMMTPLLTIRTAPACLHFFRDPRMQACAASSISFLFPCILLGMTTPYLLRLSARDLNRIGGSAGSLYAVSTTGSIAGTFLVSFILTQWLGTMKILWSTGIFLFFLGWLCFFPARKIKWFALLLILFLAGAGAFFLIRYAEKNRLPATLYPQLPPDSLLRRQENAVNREIRESAYHLIAIFESQINCETGKLLPPAYRARYMRFNEHNESGCLLKEGKVVRPIVTTCGYTRLMKCGLLVAPALPEKVLMIGAGGGVFAQILTCDYPGIKQMDVVDVDPAIFELAGKYFDYPWPDRESSPIRSHTADGRAFLTRCPDGEYDFLILDAFTSAGRIPKHLVTREFFSLAAKKMKRDGVLTMNLVGTLNSPDDEFVPAVLATLASVFHHVYVFPRNGDRNSNVIIAATDQPGELKQEAEILRNLAWIPDPKERHLLQQVVRRVTFPPPQTGQLVLTDDFCPVDSLKR